MNRNIHRRPDFTGLWICDGGSVGEFGMTVERSKRLEVGEEISGTIKDGYGLARFEGLVNKEKISFTKQYLPDAELNGATRGPIKYEGKLMTKRRNSEYAIIYQKTDDLTLKLFIPFFGATYLGHFETLTEDFKHKVVAGYFFINKTDVGSVN